MNTWILLLRGINIGGRNILRMQELRNTLSGLGLDDVRTYIQSGNAVFRSRYRSAATLCQTIRKAIDAAHGLAPQAIVLRPADLVTAIDANPFDNAEPDRLYVYFLMSPPAAPDLEALQKLRKAGERFALIGSVFYLHAPEGMASSKLGSQVERRLGVAATARNWRTVNKLAAMTV